MSIAAFLALTAIAAPKPKLVVLISIDQFRGDYIERFSDQFLPARSGGKIGGFRFLTETGAQYVDAHHNHVPTATGPGHATLMTGSEPAINGIAGNDWFNRKTGKVMYCVEDPTVKTIGSDIKPMSPRNLKVTTVGDELKLATNGKSKVVGVAFKDRASILMAGHAADTVIWFDDKSGNWVTSSFYADKLPTWVESLNSQKIPQSIKGQKWEPLLPNEAYSYSRLAPFAKPNPGGPVFSHGITETLRTFTTSSFGQDYVFKTVETAIDAEKLGQRNASDVLVVNLSTNDYVGHMYGPNSPEVQDITIRTDRLLSNLFNMIDKKVGIDNVIITLTGDHGVVPIVEESNKVAKTGVKRIAEESLGKAVESAFEKTYGPGKYLASAVDETYVYLDHAVLADKKIPLRDAEKLAAQAIQTADGVFAAFTRTQILEGELPKFEYVNLLTNGYNKEYGGDVIFMINPGYYLGGGTGTGHGAIWKYDSSVPIILRGPGVNKGRFTRTVYTSDIATSLSILLGIVAPSGSIGHPLFEALDKK